MRNCALVVLIGVFAAGCATTTPPISHVHVGHALTGWVDTPEQRGLFVTAEKEAMTVADQAKLASESQDLAAIKRHAHAIIHAIDPSRESSGPGTGYGLRKALVEADAHMGYAAQSPDASRNLKSTVENYHRNQAVVMERAELILALAESIVDTDSPAEASALAKEMHKLAIRNLKGVDEDGDGVIGSTPREYGLKQLRTELMTMTERETDPAYQAVPQRFLFGLVRLPDGTWSFRDPDAIDAYDRY